VPRYVLLLIGATTFSSQRTRMSPRYLEPLFLAGFSTQLPFLTPLSDQDEPLPPYFVPIEVKNLREWLYPRTPEVHQLLYKAAALQVGHPDHRWSPSSFCRRAHTTTYYMAFQLGFHVVDTRSQFNSPRSRWQGT
jgi:hypothetical protein